ncbi:hypothetical protein QX204_02610 [Nocardia sp. PE-7]|uniref:hypothetical protein n=1 Tax=Nocardia sp. PE-7 TaxID=3058426 RepID=UPI0026582580|nr:hypothetical protein [Nocardia sp. PE-7]WKG10413.1 hypothetical protein QX204_02610 [Nocardia sp. PE-7]
MIRTLLIALSASCTLACTSADLTTSSAPSCPAEVPFATTHSAGLTIHAPQPPGWSTQPVEGGGLVLHRFETIEGADPPFGMATVTVAIFSPASTADAASSTLRILRPNESDWHRTRSEEVQICGNTAHLTTGTNVVSHHDYLEFAYPLGDKFYPIQIATQTPVANVSRYRADLDAILSGVRITAQ